MQLLCNGFITSATSTATSAYRFHIVRRCGFLWAGAPAESDKHDHVRENTQSFELYVTTERGIAAHSGANAPLVTMAFQSSPPQPAKIQQSFQGLSCGAFQPGSKVNYSDGMVQDSFLFK